MIGNRYIAFIGGGHITEILLHNFAGGGVLAADRILVSDPLQERRRNLGEQFGVETTADNTAAAR